MKKKSVAIPSGLMAIGLSAALLLQPVSALAAETAQDEQTEMAAEEQQLSVIEEGQTEMILEEKAGQKTEQETETKQSEVHSLDDLLSGIAPLTEQESDEKDAVEEDAYTLENAYTFTVTFGAEGSDLDAEDAELLSELSVVIGVGEQDDIVRMNIAMQKNDDVIAQALAEVEDGCLKVSLPEIDDTLYQFDACRYLQNAAESMAAGEDTDGDNDDDVTNLLETIGKWGEVLTPYVARLSEYVMANTQTVEGEFDLPLLSAQVDGAVTTFTLTGTGLEDLLNDLALQIENDQALEELLVDAVNQTENVEEASAELMAMDIDAESLLDTVHQLPEALREWADLMGSLGNFGFASVCVGTEDGIPVLLDVAVIGGGSADSSDSYTGLHVEYNHDRLIARAGLGEETLAFAAIASNDENSGSGEYELRYDHETIGSGNWQYDRTTSNLFDVPDGSFTLEIPNLAYYTIETISGGEEGDDYLQTLVYTDSHTDDDAVNVSLWENLNVKSGADLLSPSGRLLDVTDYTQEEWTDLGEQLSEKAGELLSERLYGTQEDDLAG